MRISRLRTKLVGASLIHLNLGRPSEYGESRDAEEHEKKLVFHLALNFNWFCNPCLSKLLLRQIEIQENKAVQQLELGGF